MFGCLQVWGSSLWALTQESASKAGLDSQSLWLIAPSSGCSIWTTTHWVTAPLHITTHYTATHYTLTTLHSYILRYILHYPTSCVVCRCECSGCQCSGFVPRWSDRRDAGGCRGVQPNLGGAGPGRNRTDQPISTGQPITLLIPLLLLFFFVSVCPAGGDVGLNFNTDSLVCMFSWEETQPTLCFSLLIIIGVMKLAINWLWVYWPAGSSCERKSALQTASEPRVKHWISNRKPAGT